MQSLCHLRTVEIAAVMSAAEQTKGRPVAGPPFPSPSLVPTAYAVSDAGSTFTPGPMVELSEIFLT